MPKKPGKPENFEVGNIIKWKEFKDEQENENMQCVIANCRNDHGDGPFIVSKIENIPLKKTRDLRKSIGHHQFVRLKGIDIKFSGALLKKVKK